MLEDTQYFMGKDGFNWFVGVVEDRNDPQKAGRVKVRCVGHHTEDIQDIPTADLPWASVMMPVTAGGNSGIGFSPHFLIEGTWVVGFFRDPAKQEPIIMGTLPGVNTSATTNFTVASSSASGGQSTKGGFKDQGVETKPVGNQGVVYPTALYVDKADTNVIASQSVVWTKELEEGQAHHPSFAVKGGLEIDEAVHTKWTNASEAEIQQPVSTQANTKYPFNHVLETESGHYIEFDDTKDNERIHIFHKAGTFIEIDPTGNVVIKTVGNVTNIVAGNMDTHVVGNYSLSVGGNMDVYAVGNLTEKVDGNRKTTITGTETLEITGAVTNTLKDALTLDVTADVTETFGAALNTTITGATTIDGTGAVTVKSGAALSAEAAAAATLKGSTVSFN